MADYQQFKFLLKRFIQTAERNISEKFDRTTSLGKEGFENNDFKKIGRYDSITLANTEVQIHLCSSGNYGIKPERKGSGSGKIPYIDYEFTDGYWVNIRTTFEDYKITKLQIVKWKSNKKDEETGIEYKVDDLDIFSEGEANRNVKELYDDFFGFKKNKEGRDDSMVDYQIEFSEKLLDSKNMILQGAPGTGKTYLANQIAADIISKGRTTEVKKLDNFEKSRISSVQFHPSYDYTDFVEGLRPVISKNEEVSFKLMPGTFKRLVDMAKLSPSDKKYVFIIDEINRGEISKIFGELFFSIDPSYRGNKEGVLTQYANLHADPEEKFYVPDNVYIIGTMNDIDRSVDTFDFAMRRRFAFYEITTKDSAKRMLVNDKVKNLMTRLNDALVNKEQGGLTEDYQLGASYFLDLDKTGLDEKRVKQLWNTRIEPLLKDYFRGEHHSSQKLKKLESAYFGEVDTNENQGA
uniref:AAA family ATPase n=1 Tax=Levilactobacillus brevis TaxID=1580 RepID=UPI00159BDCDF